MEWVGWVGVSYPVVPTMADVKEASFCWEYVLVYRPKLQASYIKYLPDLLNLALALSGISTVYFCPLQCLHASEYIRKGNIILYYDLIECVFNWVISALV